nr:TMV resistance protein N [Tanacetum cinerariifolium]
MELNKWESLNLCNRLMFSRNNDLVNMKFIEEVADLAGGIPLVLEGTDSVRSIRLDDKYNDKVDEAIVQFKAVKKMSNLRVSNKFTWCKKGYLKTRTAPSSGR